MSPPRFSPSPPRPSPDRLPPSGRQQDDEEEERQLPTSTTVGRTLDFPVVVDRYLDEYRTHLVGAMPSSKHLENVTSKMGRLRAFLAHMASEKTGLGSWRFLNDAARVLSWPADLTGRGRAITTVKVYLVNVRQFMTYFSETPPRSSRLSKTQIVSIIRALKQANNQIGTPVLLQQLRVMGEKVQRCVTPDILRRCFGQCHTWIPRLLERSSRRRDDISLRHLLYGFLATFLASTSGHRAGVVTNMTVQEVGEARRSSSPDSPGVVINVSSLALTPSSSIQ